MTNAILLILIAAVGGIAVALQAQFMGLMDKGIGTVESVFITYGSGGLAILLVMLALRGGNLSAWRAVPLYALTTGLLGLLLIGAIGYTVPRLGLVATLVIVTAAQFIVGAVLDHFGLLGAAARPLDVTRLIGMAVVLTGTWLILR